mmetsp:Transcript_36193/g.121206  ORF Transcript_36193/g.121206 Transcript_36193/m.121206 type:complete len:423 (-) Transcript_36193:673-1941(-)
MSGKEKAAICGGRPDARLLPRSRWAQYNTTARARACSPKPDRRARACLARGVSSSPSPTKHRLTPRLASTEARPPGRYDVAPKRWSVTAAASRAQPCRAMAPRVCRQKWRHRVAVITSAWPAIAMGQTTRKIRRTARAAAGSCAAPLRLLKAATLLPFSAAGMLQLAPIRVARERAAIAQKKERTYLTSRGATPTVLEYANLRAGPGTPCWNTPQTSGRGDSVVQRAFRASCEREGLQRVGCSWLLERELEERPGGVFGFHRVQRLLQTPRRPRARWRKGQHQPAATCPPSPAHPHPEAKSAALLSGRPTRPDTCARSSPAAAAGSQRPQPLPQPSAASTRREARAVLAAPWPSYRGRAPGAAPNRTRRRHPRAARRRSGGAWAAGSGRARSPTARTAAAAHGRPPRLRTGRATAARRRQPT